MKGQFYIVESRVRKCINVTSEGELCCVTEMGYGNTVLEFEDGFTAFESDCQLIPSSKTRMLHNKIK